ncbi:MAG: DUF481 domain-containing protein [Sphingobium sp.]|nr:DUF481 domain-containing protein [Sphingobium sp.]
MKNILKISCCALAIGVCFPASAALPPEVQAMLDTAIAKGDKAKLEAVAEIAKATYPQDEAEIAAVVASYNAQQAAAAEEHKRQAGFFDNWKGTGEAGGFITTGNSSTKGVSAGLSLNKEGIDWRHKIRVQADYQRADGETTRNQWMASYEPNYQLSHNLYAYGLGMVERDKFQGFSNRLTASGGLGYRVIDNDSMTLDVKAGPAWRRTKWTVEPATETLNGLLGADFLWHVTPTIDFTNGTQMLWASDNSTYSNVSALTANLGGALSARLSYSWRRETSPPAGLKKTDTITRATLVYGF